MNTCYSCGQPATVLVRSVGMSHSMDIPVCDKHIHGAQILKRYDDVPVEALQVAADLAPMLTYTASLAVEGKSAVAYIAMLASIRGELNRLFSAENDIDSVIHNPLPAQTEQEQSS